MQFFTYFISTTAAQPQPNEVFIFIGIILFLGYLGSALSTRLKAPYVVLYIILGLIFGKSFLNIINDQAYQQLEILSVFALAIVGFSIGGEMKLSEIKELGKSIPVITVFEASFAFLLVMLGVFLFTRNWVLALIFGAMASATAPAATVSVLWQFGARGPLTTTIFAVVGLDDAAALMIYAFASAYARVLFQGNKTLHLGHILWLPVREIVGSLLIGFIIGVILSFIIKRMGRKNELLVVVLSALFVCSGVARLWGLSMILSCMAVGVTLINLSERNRVAFDILGRISNPFIIILFIIVGAHLDIKVLKGLGIIGAIYILMRIIGKVSGAWLGATISKARNVVKKYLGFGLLSQAGVAIGLAIETSHRFSAMGREGREIGAMVMSVVAATIFIFELIGPLFVKYAIFKAKEVDERFLS